MDRSKIPLESALIIVSADDLSHFKGPKKEVATKKTHQDQDQDKGGVFLPETGKDIHILQKFFIETGVAFQTKYVSNVTKEDAVQWLKKFLNQNLDPNYLVYYTGHGRKYSGDWVFDDFLTFEEVERLYIESHIYSGVWVKKARKNRILAVISACSDKQVAFDGVLSHNIQSSLRNIPIDSEFQQHYRTSVDVINHPMSKALEALHRISFETEDEWQVYMLKLRINANKEQERRDQERERLRMETLKQQEVQDKIRLHETLRKMETQKKELEIEIDTLKKKIREISPREYRESLQYLSGDIVIALFEAKKKKNQLPSWTSYYEDQWHKIHMIQQPEGIFRLIASYLLYEAKVSYLEKEQKPDRQERLLRSLGEINTHISVAYNDRSILLEANELLKIGKKKLDEILQSEEGKYYTMRIDLESKEKSLLSLENEIRNINIKLSL